MKRLSTFALALAVATMFTVSAFASPADGALASLNKANDELTSLLNTTDKAKQTTLQSDIQTDSAAVDQNVKAAISDKSTSMIHSAKLKAFQEVWSSYKKTRDAEVVPAALAGKTDAAKAAAKGLGDKFSKMKELLASVGAK